MCECNEESQSDVININRLKAKSVPINVLPQSSENLLTAQISAPSYLFSLKDNPAPPFRKPGKKDRPKLLLDCLVQENDVINFINAAENDTFLKKYLGMYLINKNVVVNYNISERDFLVSLLLECIEYAAQRDFPAIKLACMLTIYLSTHMYFKFYYWLPPSDVWKFFKELMICHTIEDSPDGQEVFDSEECYEILSHFHTIYMNNLPLIHIRTFSVHRLKFTWPFKPRQ